MPVDLYLYRTEEELLAILRKLQDALASGQITSVSAAGVSTSRQIQATAHIEKQIFQVRRALFKLNSEVYTDPALERITRTVANYIE